MDSWFTQAPLLRALNNNGLHTIGMVKQLKQKYVLDHEHLSLKELYGKIPKQPKADSLGSVRVKHLVAFP